MRAAISFVVLAALGTACASRQVREGGPRSSMAITTCPAAESATRRDTATLTIVIRTEPAAPARDSAMIRLEGETMRNALRVNPAESMRLDLPRGIYDARISLDGYSTVAGRVTLTGGCDAEMTATLRRR